MFSAHAGVKNQQEKDGLGDGVENQLHGAEAPSFRSTVARANFLVLDRPGSGVRNQRVVPKDVGPNESRHKRTPTGVRYLVSARHLVYEFPCQFEPGCICGHGFREVSGHSVEHLKVRSNDGPTPHHALEHDAKRR